MTPKQMLENLNNAGNDSASDYHDGLDGWFGWNVTAGVLTVTFGTDEGADLASWRLVPIGGGDD